MSPFEWLLAAIQQSCLFSLGFVLGAWWHDAHYCRGCERRETR